MEEAEGAGSADGQAWKYMCAELKTFLPHKANYENCSSFTRGNCSQLLRVVGTNPLSNSSSWAPTPCSWDSHHQYSDHYGHDQIYQYINIYCGQCLKLIHMMKYINTSLTARITTTPTMKRERSERKAPKEKTKAWESIEYLVRVEQWVEETHLQNFQTSHFFALHISCVVESYLCMTTLWIFQARTIFH